MTSFVQPKFPRVHGGATRFADAMERAQTALSQHGSAAVLATVLLAGGMAAVVVVAEQIVSAWADGHLLAAWIAMWVIVFGLFLFAAFSDALRAWPVQWQAQWQARRQAAVAREADERTWAAAVADPRLMAELDCALLRAQHEAQANGQPMPVSPFAGARTRSASQVRWG